MIKITKPKIIQEKNKSKLVCDIYINKEKKTIWFEVGEQYGKYLTFERSDAFLIAVLPLAMREKHDIICEEVVTEELLYKIETYLIPSLVKHSSSLYYPKINSKTDIALDSENNVGTGCSCGVDSMHAILNNLTSKYKSLNLTHLCIFNVGSFNECYLEYGMDKVRDERIKEAEKVSKKLKLPLIITNSNVFKEIPQYYLYTHTYYSMFALYCIQKLFRTYYYASSGYDFSEFTIKNSEKLAADKYSLLLLDCLSNNNLKIYSEGGTKNRIEKIQFIKDYKLTQEHLHVCTRMPYNCGICSKCRRTLLILDSLNVINKYEKIFDIDYYKQNKEEYYLWLYNEYLNDSKMNKPTFEILKNNELMKSIIKKNKFKKLTKIKVKINNIKKIRKEKGTIYIIKYIKNHIISKFKNKKNNTKI